jgi:hypothetical protein
VRGDGRASVATALGGRVQEEAKWAEHIYKQKKYDFLRSKDFK